MRRRPMRRAARKTHDYCWVTTLVETSVAENVIEIDLVTAGTWEANANNFERATLVAIKGWLCWNQYAASTNIDLTGLFLGIYKAGLTETANFDPRVAGDYDITDLLWTHGVALGESSNGDNSTLNDTYLLDVKVKRKLDSATKITLAAGMPSDAATPQGNLIGVVRCLIDRA